MPEDRTEKNKAIDLALMQIEKQFGKGSIMRLGAKGPLVAVEVIPTGALSFDAALGVGGLPRGRVVEIYGPESSGKTTLARAIAADPMLTMYDEPFAGLDPITLNVIAELVRKLNDAIGTTSIVVTYDVSESLKVVDYIYVISDGVVVGEGTPEAVAASEDPYLKQFMHALPDGPVRFHFPAEPIDEELHIA